MGRWTKKIGTWLWVGREWLVGEPELHVLGSILDHSGVFVDTGANTGAYSLTASRFAGQVVAFEPNPHLAAHLQVVLRARDRVREAAASDTVRTETFVVPDGRGIGQHSRGALNAALSPPDEFTPSRMRTFPVRTCVLDEESLGAVQLLKIDVEGHENAVLRGAASTIEARRPVVLVEAEERHSPGTIAEMQAFLESRSYGGWFVHRGDLLPFDRFGVDVHQADRLRPNYREQRSRDYVNNFIWVPRERDDLVSALRQSLSRGRVRSVLAMARGGLQ